MSDTETPEGLRLLYDLLVKASEFPGETGSGKSLSSIRLAERVDPNFNVDRIVFTVQDFLALVNSGLPPGSVIVFDDAGLGINARLWQEMNARVFGMLTQGDIYGQ